MPQWLKNAVFYEIYPQSYNDTNGDGIGDINGITEKLDYVKHLGFNALWLNPCYVSPFLDAGYDVEDYYTVAPRYGTNEDLYRLFDEAHKRDMHVILDLVPGHTSDRCKWFVESKKAERNQYSDTYTWTNCVWDRPMGYNWVCGMTDRDGCYMVNFFNSQPALNFGFDKITHPDWQISYTDPRAQATFDKILDVMRFWLDHGADGFRVDMADSLVKNDDSKHATATFWKRARKMLDEHYPEAMMVSEWCNAPRSINDGGFHCDFVLSHHGKLTHEAFRRFDNGVNGSYFCKTAHVSADKILHPYLEDLQATKGKGYVSLITGNHDTDRISRRLDPAEVRLAYTFLLTMPGVPFFYYGEEIGMRYIPQPTKEGGYNRTGTRTPMQWDSEQVNLGFSTAPTEKLYLDVDRLPNAPCAKQQMADPNSLLNFVRALNGLRQANPDLLSDGDLEILHVGEDGALCYKRGQSIVVALNPTDGQRTVPVQLGKVMLTVGGAKAEGKNILLDAQSAVIFSI